MRDGVDARTPASLRGVHPFGVLATATLLCLLGGAAALYVHKPPNPDQAIFDYIGWVGSTGGRYYLDVAEQNFPGEMLLHELGFRIFGLHYWAYRALDFCILLAGAGALMGLLRRAGAGAAAPMGALTYVLGYVSSNGWMSGQRDVVAANLLLVVGYVFARRLLGASRWILLTIGPLLFLALLLRPTYILFALALPVIDWWSAKRAERRPGTILADVIVVAASLLACLAALTLWGHAVGSLSAFYEQSLLFNTQAYSAGHSRRDTLVKLATVLAHFAWFFPAVLIGIRHTWSRDRVQAPLMVLLSVGGLALISAFVQNKGFGYHLGAVLPVVFGFAGVGGWVFVGWLRQHASIPPWKLAGGALATGLALVGLALQVKSLGPQLRYVARLEPLTGMMAREGAGYAGFSWADMIAASEYVSSTTDERETILVWGRPVSIHLLAKRRSATRFITYGMLVLAKPPFAGAERWQRDFEEMLATRPPTIVFLPTVGDFVDYGAFTPEDNTQGVIASLRRAIGSNYEAVREFGSLRAYRLRKARPSDAPATQSN